MDLKTELRILEERFGRSTRSHRATRNTLDVDIEGCPRPPMGGALNIQVERQDHPDGERFLVFLGVPSLTTPGAFNDCWVVLPADAPDGRLAELVEMGRAALDLAGKERG